VLRFRPKARQLAVDFGLSLGSRIRNVPWQRNPYCWVEHSDILRLLGRQQIAARQLRGGYQRNAIQERRSRRGCQPRFSVFLHSEPEHLQLQRLRRFSLAYQQHIRSYLSSVNVRSTKKYRSCWILFEYDACSTLSCSVICNPRLFGSFYVSR
jgi:hypothetical protein